jgi:hypothetical protein
MNLIEDALLGERLEQSEVERGAENAAAGERETEVVAGREGDTGLARRPGARGAHVG